LLEEEAIGGTLREPIAARIPLRGPRNSMAIHQRDVGKLLLASAGMEAVRLPERQPLTGFPVSLGAWFGQDLPPAALPSSSPHMD
jgi:hypothetical protein